MTLARTTGAKQAEVAKLVGPQLASSWTGAVTAQRGMNMFSRRANRLLSVEGEMPSLDSATEWLNSEPLTAAGLRGHAVLVTVSTSMTKETER